MKLGRKSRRKLYIKTCRTKKRKRKEEKKNDLLFQPVIGNFPNAHMYANVAGDFFEIHNLFRDQRLPTGTVQTWEKYIRSLVLVVLKVKKKFCP